MVSEPMDRPFPNSCKSHPTRANARLPAAILLLGVLAQPCPPSAAQQAKDTQAAPYTLEVNVNRVLVQVVVRDHHGRVVNDLSKEDFQVFDNDKPRAVSGFIAEKWAGANASAAGAVSSPGGPSADAAQSGPATAQGPRRFIVFLFDDLHLTNEDLAHAQKASIRVLDGALTGANLAAVVSLSGATNTGLMRDRAKL